MSKSEKGGLSHLFSFAVELATSQRYTLYVAVVLLLWEALFNVIIIHKVPYTEIDWIAYMEEVAGPFEQDQWDYLELKGCTGILPYPAGFVYIYGALYYLTDKGTNILRAQYIFAALHVVCLAFVFAIYAKARATPPWVLGLLCLSHRIHSIFVLRLFNDCFAATLLYVAILLILYRKWTIGCAVFSLAVSVKMNVILYAPALGLVMVKMIGISATLPRVALCAVIQVALAIPFLQANWVGYVSRAFDLGRVFTYKWTVNLHWLGEELFVSKEVAMALLAGHASFLLLFLFTRWTKQEGGLIAVFRHQRPLSSEHIVALLFTCNFIGIVFARTLHYQFYVWYFHTLPFLLWQTELPVIARLLIMAVIEGGFQVFPATTASSAALTAAHIVLLASLYFVPKLQARAQKAL